MAACNGKGLSVKITQKFSSLLIIRSYILFPQIAQISAETEQRISGSHTYDNSNLSRVSVQTHTPIRRTFWKYN